MSLTSWERTLLPQLQAKIGLLQQLNDTPSSASENTPPDTSISRSSHVLPFLKEKELVQTLAFIASSTDDPAKVIAVCVEEGLDQKSMTVRLAVNTGGLDNVVAALRRIAIILERINSQAGGETEIDDADVKRVVVRLNRNRILCRLRSRHAKTKSHYPRLGRPKPLLSLADVLADTKKSASQDVQTNLLPQVEEFVEELRTRFSQFEKLSEREARSELGLVLLLAIVLAARKLHCSRSLGNFLEMSDYDDTKKIHIRCTISKLGRYSNASEFLVRAARKYTVFSNVMIKFVKLPALLFPPIKHPDTFAETLKTGLLSAKEMQKVPIKVLHRLDTKILANECSRISSAKFKVHAEIQLLFHYESYNAPLRPRILCSSKHACFLCELFIRIHGKFFLPSTHGRLYAQWTLPTSLGGLSGEKEKAMIVVLGRFASSIQTRLKDQIVTANKPFPAPNESVMLGSTVWSEADEAAPATPCHDSGYDEAASKSNETSSVIEIQTETSSESREPSSDLIPRADLVHDITDQEPENIVSSAMVEPFIISPADISSPYTILVKGQAMSFDLSQNTKLVKVSTPRIHLTFSYATWKESAIVPSNPELTMSELGCKLTLSWLHESDVVDPSLHLVDLAIYSETFQETFDELAGSCDFYVVKGRDIVSIKTVYLST